MDDTMQIPGYIIEGHIGSGAMATVYLALHKNLERRVALKLMAGSLVTDDTFRERFLKEGKIVAQLNHPNIITIYDIGVVQSNYFMAMEYVNGGTLKDRIKQAMPPTEAVEILVALASALGYAHKRNFIHRDVKPANILFREDGTPVLSDFGIAKSLGGGTQMTRTGWAVGTPSYMSPEQALGKEVDSRCDLYSLGVMFHEMLTGEKPYKATDSFAVALMHVNDPIPKLPAELSAFQPIINRLMAKKPDDRFADADELITALKPFRAQQVTDKTAPSAVASRWPLWTGAVTASLVLGLGGYFGYMQFTSKPPPASNTNTAYVSPIDPFGIEPQTTRPLSPAQQAEVAGMLEMAELNLEFGRLVDPPVSNAAHGFREVLKLDPSNAAARAGLLQIAEHFLEQAQQGLAEGDAPGNLRGLVEAGLVAMPKHPELLALKQEIDQGLNHR